MASLQELKGVVKETLESRGVLNQIKARIRAEVFNALDDHSDVPPPLSNENMLINELIREYLEFNKYKYTASVLQAEAGQPEAPLDREFLAEELNILEDRETASVPLLYGITAYFLSRKQKVRGDIHNGPQVPWRPAGVRPAGTSASPHHPHMHKDLGDHHDLDGAVGHSPVVFQGGHR